MGQKLLGAGEALVAGSVGGHPVADVLLGLVGEHEAVRVQRVSGERGRVQGGAGIHEGVSRLAVVRAAG